MAQVSHGIGGAGNIGPDETSYTDGGVTRAGEQGTGLSTGRGGAGNIDPSAPATASSASKDIIPDEAKRLSGEEHDYHGGIGGAGNEHHQHAHSRGSGSEHSKRTAEIGMADKMKAKLMGLFKK